MDVDLPREVLCPLCLDLVHDPVSTACRHTFCRSCICRVLSTGHSTCPLCRQNIRSFDAEHVEVDQAIVALVAEAVPAELVARRARESMSRLEVVVGNLYEEVPHRGRNSNKWTMYTTLRGALRNCTSNIIDKVIYELHPTFSPSVVTAHAPSFTMCRYGWGTFSVGCEVHWNPELGIPPTKLDHLLAFDSEGGRTSSSIDIDPSVMDRILAAVDNSSSSRSTLNSSTARAIVSTNASGYGGNPARRTLQSRQADPPARDTIEVVVGNRCEMEDERYRWTMYVMLPGFQRYMGQMIDSVTYDLHPTFSPSSVSSTSPPFEIRRIGWGTFPVTCTIQWKRDLRLRPTTITHDLKFENGGARTAATVGVNDTILRRFQSSR